MMKTGLTLAPAALKIKDVLMLLPGHRVATGDISVADGRISAIDLHDVTNPDRLVLPGFVNAHGHTPMTLLRGLGGGLPLDRWLHEAIFPVEAKMKSEDVKAGMTWGILEMLAGGTTAVADMYDFPEACAEALAEAGMRGRVCRVGLSFVPGRLEEAIAFTRRENARRAAGGLIAADFCLHSEYLTDEPFCRGLAAANREQKRPVNVHVSETKREHEECLARHGKTPIAYLADLGVFDFGGYAAHCVWCTDDDFRIMAEHRVSLVHNPTSNLKLGSGIARVAQAMALGVNVALGTDGCASNDNLNMFEEMHLASLVPKGLARDPTVLSSWDVIDMATKNGAEALGLRDCGELKVGHAADLCVVGLDRPHLLPHPPARIPDLVVHAMQAGDVVLTMVNGNILYENGDFPTLDRERAKFDFLCAVRRLAQ